MSWLKSKDGHVTTYSAFASDLDGYRKSTGKNPRCPVCREGISMYHMYRNPIAHGEEPQAEFKPCCPHCGLILRVFND